MCIRDRYYIYLQTLGSTALRVSMLFSREELRTWILPVFSMSLGNIAYYAMWLRRYMVDENNKDYVKLARAKGVNESKITMRHVFRNAFVPMIQYIPTSLMYKMCIRDRRRTARMWISTKRNMLITIITTAPSPTFHRISAAPAAFSFRTTSPTA